MKVKFGVITEPFKARVDELELATLKPDEVLIKMEASNICSGDYTQYIGLRNHQGFPHAGGHEWAGLIHEKGCEVSSAFKIGDRVAGVPGKPCGECEQCQVGNILECETTEYYSVDKDGYYGDRFFANYAIVKARTLIPVSKTVDAAHAAMLEPLSTCVQAAKISEITPGEDVVIIGAGTMGILNAQVSNAYGARVIITDLVPKKLNRAKNMGIANVIDVKNENVGERVRELTNGKGADVVIVCVGNTSAYKQAMEVMKQYRARMILFPAGFPKPELQVDPNEIHYRKMKLIGAYGSTVEDFYDAETLLRNNKIDVSFAMENMQFPIEEFESALKVASEPDRYRVTVVF